MAKEKSLEASMEALEEVIAKLEEEDTSLEDSFKLYQSGMKLLKECNNAIDRVEKKLIVLNGPAKEEM